MCRLTPQRVPAALEERRCDCPACAEQRHPFAQFQELKRWSVQICNNEGDEVRQQKGEGRWSEQGLNITQKRGKSREEQVEQLGCQGLWADRAKKHALHKSLVEWLA
jgi:hypothetical protein